MQSYKIPLPSHFTRDGFTIAALDNFDFQDNSSLSGTHGTHDTALVLFQDCCGRVAPGKPTISETSIAKWSCKLVPDLPCQKVKNYSRPVIQPSLPEDLMVSDDMNILSSGDVVAKAAMIESNFYVDLSRK